MQKAIICNIDEKFLECGTEFSDRFVYSYYFVPLSITFDDNETPILPEYKKWWLLFHHMSDPLWIYKMKDVAERLKIPLPDLLKKNDITLPLIGPGTGPKPGTGPGIGPRPGTTYPTKDKIKANVSDVQDIITLLRGKVSESDRGMVDLIERKTKEIDAAVEEAPLRMYGTPAESAKMMITYSTAEVATVAPSTALQQAQEIDSFLNALKGDVGYLFLDRTRIRPKGFAIGEHIYDLSLSPGEEVVLEQKTFSKRSMTFEEQDEEERQFDLEFSSTLTNEIQEGFERQTSLTDARGFQVGGSLGAEYKGVQVNANASYSRNITEANNQTKTRSVKQSQTASSKTASKYRAMHKVTFKISTEEGFESTSKRVIKNPNKYTAVDLHYFKILQVLEMSQERYGVRLCWAPYIKDPVTDFLTRIKEGKDKIIKDAIESVQLPSEPPMPVEVKVAGGKKKGDKVWEKWNLDGSTDSRDKIEIEIPENYNWDYDIEKVKRSVKLVLC